MDYDAINDDIAKAIRNMAIEECAKIAMGEYAKNSSIMDTIAAIRALKDKQS